MKNQIWEMIDTYIGETIQSLLDNGWEPYAVTFDRDWDRPVHYFRRLVQK